MGGIGMTYWLGAIRAIGFATYKEWAAFRSHMVISILVGPVYYLVQYFVWRSVYSGRDVLHGFTLDQMLVYFGVAAVFHYLTFDFADWNLQMLVRTGKFVTFALRPVPHWFFALSQKIGHRSLGFWLEFLPIFLIFQFVFNIDLRPAMPGWAAISIVLAFLMNFFVNYCVGLTAFWIVRADAIRRVILLFKDVSGGLILPLAFFPDIMQKVLFFLPFQYITYLPTRVYIGEYELAGVSLTVPQAVGLQAIAVSSMFGLMLLLYHLGMRRFAGEGV
jgi:ABC-2 type transport system permease protein